MVVKPGEAGTRRTGVVMKKKREVTIRLSRLGLSLLAAGLTAVGVAAVSLADSGNDNASNGSGSQTFQAPAPGGGVGVMSFRGPNLSDADEQKMEDFRQCMEDNGAPAPPRIDSSDGPPKPPSSEEMDKAKQAYEACKDKLPEELQRAGFPPHPPCGPPPGAPGQDGRQGQDQGQNQGQDYVVPAPQGPTS
jgi:hypothetical protein